MKVKSLLTTSAVLGALALPVSAQDVAFEGNPFSAQSQQDVSNTTQLSVPFTHAVTFRGKDGIAMISQNGRFIIKGSIYDVWTGKVLETIDDIEASKTTLNLTELGVDEKDLDPLYFGSGPKEVTIFVDPLCPYCQQVFQQMVDDPTIAEDYRFKIYTVPYLGEQSVVAVNALSCTSNKSEALTALLTKDARWMKANAPKEPCDVQPVLNRTLLAQMVGVTGVPFLIGAEGGISRGVPNDLREFLAYN